MSRKQLIMDKALELFSEKTIESTSIQQITDRCGISKGAFYLSFKSKDELVVALIDQFMAQYIAKIDRVVNTTNTDNLLYEFYFHSCLYFQTNSAAATFFFNEQTMKINEEFIKKIHEYNGVFERITLKMINKVFNDTNQLIKYELLLIIKSFFNMYVELYFITEVELNIDKYAKSMVEKIHLIANHSKISFINTDIVQTFLEKEEQTTLSKDNLVATIEQQLAKLDNEESLLIESLQLLKADLLDQQLPRAVIIGLIENIKGHPQTIGSAFLLMAFYQTH